MKSFKKFLKEAEDKKVPALIPAPVRTVKPSVPTTYSDPSTGVRSFFHTTPKGESYWGYGVADSAGNLTDTPQAGLSNVQKSQISRTARGHMEDFLKTHPEVKKITYQTNPTPQGQLNRSYFKEKMWPEMQAKTGTKASFVEVPKNPLTRSSLATGAASIGAGIVGALAGEYLVKPAAEKAGVFKAVETGTRKALSSMPSWAANVADVGLGVAQTVLDPISATAPLLQTGIDANAKREVDAAIKAGKPSQVRVTGPKL